MQHSQSEGNQCGFRADFFTLPGSMFFPFRMRPKVVHVPAGSAALPVPVWLSSDIWQSRIGHPCVLSRSRFYRSNIPDYLGQAVLIWITVFCLLEPAYLLVARMHYLGQAALLRRMLQAIRQ